MTEKEKKILLVDDEERLLNSMSQRISLLGFVPLKASSGIQAIEIVKKTRVDLAIVDLKMPDMDGLVTITKLKEIAPNLKTVLLTGYGSQKTKQATEALGSMYVEKDSMGGLWEIIKQFSDQGKVVVIRPPSSTSKSGDNSGISGQVEILNSFQYKDQDRGNTAFLKDNGQNPSAWLPNMVGESRVMQQLKKNIKRFAEMECAIVIKGENGTGKELTARWIHQLSRRKNQRFLAFDCGCFSNDFHFSELVNSFEGTSVFHRSDGDGAQTDPMMFSGTILLDHIENMPDLNQKELMNLLDGKAGTGGQLMDIRFMVASNGKLEEKIAEGGRVKTLYNRIRAAEIEIPPLRDRMEDLPVLIKYFLSQSSREFDKNIQFVSDEALKFFQSYAFPGNVRELKHIMERAVILADDNVITPDHLPERMRSAPVNIPSADTGPFLTIQEMEKNHILKALDKTGGNKSRAAELLGISRAALWRKLRSYKQES